MLISGLAALQGTVATRLSYPPEVPSVASACAFPICDGPGLLCRQGGQPKINSLLCGADAVTWRPPCVVPARSGGAGFAEGEKSRWCAPNLSQIRPRQGVHATENQIGRAPQTPVKLRFLTFQLSPKRGAHESKPTITNSAASQSRRPRPRPGVSAAAPASTKVKP